MSDLSPAAAIAHRIAEIQATLPPSVRLIAVTKQVSIEAIRAAYAAGIRDFAESRIQEATPKQEALQDLPDITWHFIGHLQGNKAQRAFNQFQWIHSVDSLKLAQRLDRLTAEQTSPQLCLQIKPLPDPSKYGWSIPEFWQELPELEQCQHLKIVGLMTILPQGLTPAETQAGFLKVQELADQLNRRPNSLIRIDHLSMGMSSDYSIAVAAGATMIRLGRTLFGERPL
jgi:pyridoxal phosphate enzyme (YggS family)